MSEKKEKKTKAADAPAPVEAIAASIIDQLDRVHVRKPRF